MIHEKAENIKRPLKLGEEYSVACIVKRDEDNEIIYLYPVINHPHNDTENGQLEVHYHADNRFVKGFKDGSKVRFEIGIDGELEYHILPVVNEKHDAITQQFFIRNSKLKHKCIIKGKCPHRGYDLSQENVVDGKITCPLHGLVFDAETGEIDKNTLEQLAYAHNTELKFIKDMKAGLSKLSKIKDGDIITQKQYNELYQYPLTSIFSIYTKPVDGYIEYEWCKAMTEDYRPKPIKNGETLKFKVKL